MKIKHLLGGLALCGSVLLQAQEQKRPNVLLIYTDDQGSVDVNCYGAKDLITPNLDQMAEDGIKFSQFYVAAPVCTPSRAALMTGRTPHRAELPENTSSRPGHAGLPTDQFTIAEAFKANGYNTAHIGKWHLGYSKETMPNAQGFDHSFGHMGGCIDNYSHFFYWDGPNRHDLWRNGEEIFADGQYFPELMLEEAVNYMDEHKDDTAPFFMYYALNLPHYPVQPLEKWREKYKDLPMPRRDYAAFMSTVDEYVGRLVDSLEARGLIENTIVVYQSDHGHSVEERNFNGGGDAGPFRGAKGCLFEGAIRVPTFIQWPGVIPSGETRTGMAVNSDWFPTLLDFCGINPQQYDIDGTSLKGMILDKNTESPRTAWRWKYGYQWAARKGDWKLLGFPYDKTHKAPLDPDKDALFLVNLSQDSTEMVNLATQYPEKVEELKAYYLDWEYASKDDLPFKITENQHVGFKADIKTLTPLAGKFTGQEFKLVDGYRGTKAFGDGYWIAYNGDDMEVIIDLGKKQKVSSVSTGFLSQIISWIFLPESVSVQLSNDGKKFGEVYQTPAPDLGQKKITVREVIEVQFPKQKARYIKVKAKNIGQCPSWHTASGSDAWMFVDEIVIN